MVLQVQFLSKFIGINLLFMCLSACDEEIEENVVVRASEHNYYTSAGITYIDSLPFTGSVYEMYGQDTAFIRSYSHGKQNGLCKEWYKVGRLKEIRWYKNNRKEGEHIGWHENGRQKFVAHFRNDMYEGNVKEWLESGQLFKDFNYSRGQEEGMQRMYWADGSVRANYQCKNGRNYGLTGVKNCVSVWADSVGH